MLFIKGIYLLLSHLPTSHTFGGCLSHHPPSIGLHPSSRCIIAIGEKPPKSGLIC